MKYVWCVLACVVPAAAFAQPGGGELLTVETAVTLALENNRMLQVSRSDVTRLESQVAAARTLRLPAFETSLTGSALLRDVDFAFPKGAFGEYESTGPIPSTDTAVTMKRQPTAYLSAQISQPLSQLYQINLRIRAAALAVEVEKARVRDQELALVSQVRRLYFEIAQTASSIAAAEEAVALYRELDRTVAARLTQQVALRGDALDVAYRLGQEELRLTSARNAVLTKKEQLNRLLGRDVRTLFEVRAAPAPRIEEVNLASAQARAIEARPDVREARLRVRQADVDRRIARAERLPEVSLAVSYNRYFNMDVLPRNLASASVQVTWEPFDWRRRAHEHAAKATAIEQARLAVRDLEDRIALDVSARFRALSEAHAMTQVLDAAVASARERLRVRTNQFHMTAVTLTELLQTRSDVAAAVSRYQEALGVFWTARAEFERSLGEEGIR